MALLCGCFLQIAGVSVYVVAACDMCMGWIFAAFFVTQRVLGCMYVQGFDVTAHVAIGGDVYHCQMDIAVISGTGLLGASPFTMNPFVRVTLLGSDGSKVASGATGAVKRGGDNPKFSKDNVCALPYVCWWRFMSLLSFRR